MDDHGNLSPEEEASRALVELLEKLSVIAPEESRRSALERELPTRALDLLVKRAASEDPIEREEARTLAAELGLELALPDVEFEVPDD